MKEAAASAIANAMMDNGGNRAKFQQEGGVAPMLQLLRTGDLHTKVRVTCILYNAVYIAGDTTATSSIETVGGIQSATLVGIQWESVEGRRREQGRV